MRQQRIARIDSRELFCAIALYAALPTAAIFGLVQLGRQLISR